MPARPGCRGGAWVPVIGDLHGDVVAGEVDLDSTAGWRGVLDDIGECLLHDAVDRQCQGVGEFPLAADVHGGVDAGRRGLGGERSHAGQAGSRCAGAGAAGRCFCCATAGGLGVALVGAQHAEEPTHLGERPAARFLDHRQGRAGILGTGVEQVTGDGRFGCHQGHGIGDDVMEFPGDAQPLVGDGTAGVLAG